MTERTERFERTGEYRRPEPGEYYESSDMTNSPQCVRETESFGNHQRWILRRITESERTIPTHYVYTGEGKPIRVDLDEPDEPEPTGGCPCKYVEPCGKNCTCANPLLSGGCDRCCTYGSLEQRQAAARDIAERLKHEHERKAGQNICFTCGYEAWSHSSVRDPVCVVCDARLQNDRLRQEKSKLILRPPCDRAAVIEPERKREAEYPLADKFVKAVDRMREHPWQPCEALKASTEAVLVCNRAAVIEECATVVDAMANEKFEYANVATDPNRKEHYNWMGQFYDEAAAAIRAQLEKP